jgi:hypothetical protein
MRNVDVMISTTQFEVVHGREPRGMGSWSFSFPAAALDSEKMRLAVQAHNASHREVHHAYIDFMRFPGKIVISIHDMLYSEARRAACTIAKIGALMSVDTILGEVGS